MNILCCIEITCLPLCVMWQSQSASISTKTIVRLIPEPAMASSFSIQMIHLAIRLLFNILSPGPSHFYLQDLEPRQAAAAPRLELPALAYRYRCAKIFWDLDGHCQSTAAPSLLQNFTFTFAYFIRNTELDRYNAITREKKPTITIRQCTHR